MVWEGEACTHKCQRRLQGTGALQSPAVLTDCPHTLHATRHVHNTAKKARAGWDGLAVTENGKPALAFVPRSWLSVQQQH